MTLSGCPFPRAAFECFNVTGAERSRSPHKLVEGVVATRRAELFREHVGAA